MRTIFHTPAGKGCYRVRSTEAGECPKCERKLVYRGVQDIWVCPRRSKDPLWQMRHLGAKVRFEEEGREWLAAKLNLEPTNERLPEIALSLAQRGVLLVMFSQKGDLVAVAKPKKAEAPTVLPGPRELAHQEAKSRR